jgi:hypothetical protein
MKQISIDFSNPVGLANDNKRMTPASFRTWASFKAELEAMAKLKGNNWDFSKLCNEYLIRGYLEDKKTILLNQLHENTTLKDLLKL